MPLWSGAAEARSLVAMAFMSAWYQRHGDTGRRDKAAQSAALLVSGTGLDSESVFKTLLQYEHLWRIALHKSKIGRSRLGCLPILVLGLVWLAVEFVRRR